MVLFCTGGVCDIIFLFFLVFSSYFRVCFRGMKDLYFIGVFLGSKFLIAVGDDSVSLKYVYFTFSFYPSI